MITGLPDLSHGSSANPTTYNIVTSEEAATIFPEHVAELWLSYGQGLTRLDLMTYGFDNRSELVSAEYWDAHIENYPIKTMTVGSAGIVLSGTGGGTAVFQLASTDLHGSNYNYYPRVDQVCYVGSGAAIKQCHIRSISQATSTVTVTIRPSDTAYVITSTDIASGVIIPLGPVVKSVESGPTTATRVTYDTVRFYTQVQKDAQGFGGFELARRKWFNIDGKYLYDRDVMRKEFEMKAGMCVSMYMGEAVTNTAVTNVSVVDSTNIQVNSSIGLWSWGDTKGYDVDYSATAGVKVTDFDEIGEYYRSVGIPTDKVLVSCGNGFYSSAENALKDYITNATGSLNDLFLANAAGGDKDLSIGFKTIKKNGLFFTLHEEPVFNNPYLLKNLMFSNAILTPMSTVRDAKTGEYFPNFSIRYAGNKTYSRKMVVGHVPGMDGFLTQAFGYPILSTGDANSTNWLSQYGFEYRNAYEIIRMYPA
jgi:hypothetical protein